MSWYQSRPAASLKLIEACGVGKQEGIIDVGGGASVLVDFLLDAGFARLAVLDISAVALAYAKERLGARAGDVEWFEADVTGFTSPHCFKLWHDRAVFHFLTDKPDRQKYVQTLNLKTGMAGVEMAPATRHQTNPIAPRWTFRVRTH